MTVEEYIEDRGLERCEFDDECDQCHNPQGGTWTKLYHEPEGVTEAEYYVCANCLSEEAEGATPFNDSPGT